MGRSRLKLIAIIPARGGSKRIPKKNIIRFFNKPLISYTIAAAINSNVFEDIIVSTEDKNIINIAKKYKEVEILKRPMELAGDKASVMDVSNHVLNIKGDDYDYAFILLPSTPLRTHKDIMNVKKILYNNIPNAVISVTNYLFHLIYAFTFNQNNHLVRSFPELSKLKSQYSPKYCVDNGGIYALKPKYIRVNNYWPPKTYPYFMPIWSSIDIDTPENLEIAKAMYSFFVLKKKWV